MKKVLLNSLFGLGMASLMTMMGCQSSDTEDYIIEFIQPSHFPEPLYDIKNKPVTKEGFELGKALFFDSILSRDNSISCASCHNQGAAFAHANHDISHGIEDQLGIRNANTIQNVAWQNSFFWDGGVHDLDVQPLVPIKNPVEMDEDPAKVLEKLRDSAKYPSMFKAAFGTDEITSTRFLLALSQYMNMLVSANSKYDQYLNQQETLTSLELEGLQVFEQKCASCHSGILLTDQSFRNNGLPIFNLNDEGRAHITALEADKFKFRVPSLRNVAVSAPYMHDGRFWKLADVLEHYNSGVEKSATLDAELENGTVLGVPLSEQEKISIIAFLETLTDDDFLRDTRLAP